MYVGRRDLFKKNAKEIMAMDSKLKYPLLPLDDKFAIRCPILLRQSYSQAISLSNMISLDMKATIDEILFDRVKVSYDAFQDMLYHMIDQEDLDKSGRASCNTLLTMLSHSFRHFELDGQIEAKNCIVIVGLCVGGSAIEKLSAICALMIREREAELDTTSPASSLLEIEEIRAVLWMVLEAIRVMWRGDGETASKEIHTCLDFVVDDIVKHVTARNPQRDDDMIEIEHLLSWFLIKAPETAPWLELLSAESWYISKITSSAPSTETLSSNGGVPSTDGSFEFMVLGKTIGTDHASQMQHILQNTPFSHHSASEYYLEFSSQSVDGSIDEEGFIKCLCTFMPGLEKDKDLFDFFTKAFGEFCLDFTKFVDAKEIAAGFSIFAEGSKSAKLQAAFDHFDEENNGKISPFELWRFLRSVMTMLLVLSSESPPESESASTIAQHVEKGSADVMKELSANCIRNDSGSKSSEFFSHGNSFSLQDFGQWYNNGGYRDLSWLELLDMRKWCFVSPKFTPRSAIESSENFPISSKGVGSNIPAICLRTQVALEFNLEENKTPLLIDNGDLVSVEILGVFQQISLARLFTAFKSHLTVADTITKSSFDTIMDELLVFVLEDRETVLRILSSLFYSYNRLGTGNISISELLLGLTILCSGSKSEKLAFGFQVIDALDTGYISRRNLWIFLRSYLTLILSLGNGAELPPEELASWVDSAILNVTQEIFADLEIESQITFVQFAQWYSEGGYSSIPWLELLDMKKWPKLEPNIATAIESTTSASELQPSSTHFAFQFPISSIKKLYLKVRLRDVSKIRSFGEVSGLDSMNCNTVYDAFYSRYLSYSEFCGCMKNLSGDDFIDGEQELFSKQVQRIFNLYDVEENDSVDTLHVMCGLSVFCKGSKSQKLDFLFDTFDEAYGSSSGEGLTRRNIYELLAGVLTFLLSFSSSKNASGLASKAAGEITSKVFFECDKERITLQDFADWYGNSGHQVVPWIELLDIAKWPTNESAIIASEASSAKMSGFNFSLHQKTDLFQFSDDDVSLYLHVLSATGIRNIEVSVIHEVFLAECSGKSTLDRSEYYSCIRKIVQDTGMKEEDKKFASALFNRIFNVYDYDRSGTVQVKELCCGFTLLAYGSKSQKLLKSFMLFCDENGCASQAEIFVYFRSLLLALKAISKDVYESFVEDSSKLYDAVDEAVESLVKSLLHQFSNIEDHHRERISFEDFGEWYNNEGYEQITWIELLDTSKWVPKPDPQKSNINFFVNPGDIIKDFSDLSGDSGPLLEFVVSEHGAELHFLEENISVLRQFFKDTGLHLIPTRDFIEELDEFLPEKGLSIMSKESLHQSLKLVFDSIDTFDSKTLSFLKSLIDACYNATNTAKSSSFNVQEASPAASVVVGLLIFTDGTLREKLVQGMSVLQRDAGDSCGPPFSILQAEKCLRCSLTALYVLGSDLSPDTIRLSSVSGVEETIQTYVGDDDNSSTNYSEFDPDAFEDWFTDRGHRILPWMELLVLEHWPVALKLAGPKEV